MSSLFERHELGRAVFNHRGMGVALTAFSGDFLEVNEAFASMLGTQPMDLVGRHFLEITHPEDRSAHESVVSALRRGDFERLTFDKRYLHVQGHVVPVRVSLSPVHLGPDEPLATIAVVEDLSRVLRAETEARRTKALLERGARLAGLGVWSSQPGTGALEWTDQTLALFGLERHEFPGTIEGFLAHVHPEDRPRLERRLAEADLTLGIVDNEYRIVRADGQIRVMAERGQVELDDDGQLRRFGLVMDVSERREAEDKLRVSEERFRLLARATSDAVWDWNVLSDDLWWGDGFEVLFGFKGARVGLKAEHWRSRLHPDDAERAWEKLLTMMAGEAETWVTHYRFRREDGTYAFVEDRGHAIRDEHGHVVRMIGGMTDQSRQREAAERLAEQAALLDEVSDAILVLDGELVIKRWSKGAERIFGVPADEAVGASALELLELDPSQTVAAVRDLRERGEWRGEIVVSPPRHERLTTLARWRRLADEGEAMAFLAVHTDVTQQKLLEAQTLRAQRLESIGTLAGGIAHDLNNILAPILMSVDVLESEEDDPEKRELLGTVKRNGERGANMVRQLLTFARGFDGRREPVDLERIVRDVQQMLGEVALKKIRTTFVHPHPTPRLLGDATQLHQVVLNLCINARDAMPDGGRLDVAIEEVVLDATFVDQTPGAKRGRHLVISITDTGTGMTAEVAQRIFDPFFTTKAIGKGTGLGLATSLAIVKSHGGFIRVASEPRRGTCVSVYLPAEDAVLIAHEDGEHAFVPRGAGELILVVDDEPSIRSVTQQTLQRHGYRAVLACDGADAIATFLRHRQDIALVITDLMMPVMDGSALAQVLRNMAPRLPILGATGVHGGAMKQRIESLGVKQVLAKPYTARTLLQAVQQAMRS